MLDFDRVLIALELGDEDESTLAFANRLLRSVQPSRVDVVHVLDTRMVPDGLLRKYSDWLQPARQRRNQRLDARIAADLEVDDSTAVHRHLLTGAPLSSILELCAQSRTSLIIAGRSRLGNRVDTLPVRIARRAPCSVLLVPKESRPRLQELLVPVDFSRGSAYAVELAAELADRSLARRLRGLHAYALPPGAYRLGKSEKELAALVRDYAERAFTRFREELNELPVPLEMEYTLDLYPAHAVLEAARPERCDLVVVGTRGGGASGYRQLGRVAARLLHECSVPVLVTRPRMAGERPEAGL